MSLNIDLHIPEGTHHEKWIFLMTFSAKQKSEYSSIKWSCRVNNTVHITTPKPQKLRLKNKLKTALKIYDDDKSTMGFSINANDEKCEIFHIFLKLSTKLYKNLHELH